MLNLLWFAPSLLPVALAETAIRRILSHEQFSYRAEGQNLQKGDRLAIYSRNSQEVIGFAEVVDEAGIARVLALSGRERMILVGDHLRKISYREEQQGFSGRTDLQAPTSSGASVRYKPLVIYGGGTGTSAETLRRGEILIGPLASGYGLTDRLMVDTMPLGFLLRMPNADLKFKTYENDGIRFSTIVGALTVNGYKGLHGYAAAAGGLVDVQSNTKLISHTTLSIRHVAVRDGGNNELPGTRGAYDSKIASGYEYILDNWDRVLITPDYNFETRNIGGTLAYLFLWDRLNLNVSLSADNITDLRVGWNQGYHPGVDIFWRF